MKLNIALTANGEKNLNDAICDIIDAHINGGIQKLSIKAIYRTFGILGDNGNNALFSMVCLFFENVAKNLLKQNNIYATAKNLVLTKTGEELQASVDLEDIDYTKSITMNQQRIIDALKNFLPDNVTWDILDILQDDADTIVSSVLETVNNEKKELIIKLLINTFQSNICSTISNLLTDNKIDFSVKRISLD